MATSAGPTISTLALDLSLSNQEGTGDFVYVEHADVLYALRYGETGTIVQAFALTLIAEPVELHEGLLKLADEALA